MYFKAKWQDTPLQGKQRMPWFKIDNKNKLQNKRGKFHMKLERKLD